MSALETAPPAGPALSGRVSDLEAHLSPHSMHERYFGGAA